MCNRIYFGVEHFKNAIVTIADSVGDIPGFKNYPCLIDPNKDWNGYEIPMFEPKVWEQFKTDMEAYSRSFGGGTGGDYAVDPCERIQNALGIFYRPTGYCFVQVSKD